MDVEEPNNNDPEGGAGYLTSLYLILSAFVEKPSKINEAGGRQSNVGSSKSNTKACLLSDDLTINKYLQW